ncbi:MAG: hypothetical protein LBV63_00415 [Candidatus Methanoplasma sp.]|jgi:hypothetical protein|nr:hypothetical protein [Candidatus Methanoplasma sp.]
MVEDEKIETVSEEELYALLLKEFEEFKDEGRDCYLDELIDKLRKNLEIE